MIKYRYLIIYNKINKVIYGECIKWLSGEFDKVKNENISIKLKKSYKANIIITDERIDEIDNVNKKIIFNACLEFFYDDSGDEFITQRLDEIIFNPLIDKCSKISGYYSNELDANDFFEWSKENDAIIEEIKSRFDIDFLKNPELINSYTYYDPTRVIISSKFVDRRQKGIDRTKLKIKFIDEFNIYKDYKYEVIEYTNNEIVLSEKGDFRSTTFFINSGKEPDEVEIQIFNSSETIYNSRYGFIKSVSINMNVQSGSVILNNGSKVQKYSKINTDINYRE